MRYYGEEALGLVETLGLVPALEAARQDVKGRRCGAHLL